MRRLIQCAAILLVALSSTMPLAAEDVFLRADVVHRGDGTSLSPGMVHVRDGRIIAVSTDIPVPEGARVIDLEGHQVMPGMIDANSKIEPEDLLRPLAKTPRERIATSWATSGSTLPRSTHGSPAMSTASWRDRCLGPAVGSRPWSNA